MGETTADLVAFGRDYLYPNYRQPPMVLVRGEGSFVWDADGKRYLDFCAGIAVSVPNVRPWNEPVVARIS